MSRRKHNPKQSNLQTKNMHRNKAAIVVRNDIYVMTKVSMIIYNLFLYDYDDIIKQCHFL